MSVQPKLIPEISPGQSSWTAKVVVAEKNIARTAQCSLVKYQTMVLVDPQIKDCTGCIDATIMGEMVEGFLKSTAMTLVNLTRSDNQIVLQTIRTSIEEEQILYVRAMEKDAEGTTLKYDIVYMFDPVTELDEPLDSRCALNVGSNKGKGKQIVKPFKPVKRALFSLRDSESSQDDDDGVPSVIAISSHLSGDRDEVCSSEEHNVPPLNK
ncbi:hypothetical protein Adt_27868 [Abeliophyllum distichum]|uniref:Uncharacterized protein n=1 Tax=Abeliophyllum distichum TaxID=126358 RepID=A0ABD1RUY0_9LAMI